jgi:transcription initiation factor TFIID subunit 2
LHQTNNANRTNADHVQSLLKAISRVRFEDGKTPVIVRRFLIDQLRYNDNTANPVSSVPCPSCPVFNRLCQYSDAFYICTNIAALACSTLCTTPPERGELTQTETQVEQSGEDIDLMKQAIAEVDRYRNMDRLIPSYHNIVTIATLEVCSLFIVSYGY